MNDSNPTNVKQDNYLPCSFYKGATVSDNGIYYFSDGGKFYFSFMENGNVILRSEGYDTEAGRENGIASVLKNISNEGQYKVLQLADGKWIVTLEALNHQEIARSCVFDTEAEVRALLPGARAASLLQAAAPLATMQAASMLKHIDKEDDYLLCKEYLGFTVTDTLNKVALFTHHNGKYYFAVYNSDGSVKLRSEGFISSKERDDELEAVLNYVNNASHYTSIEKAGYEIKILKDNNGREIGRTCPKKIVAPVAAVKPLAAAAPVVPEVPAAGGFKWWWLLPVLLLLLLLFWWKSCNTPDAETPAVAETAIVADPEVPVAKDTDGDGILDADDKCPNLPGIADNLGCPEMILYYTRDEATLNAEDKAKLDSVVTFMNNHPLVNAIIEGHTSTLGETDYNQKLSESRAKLSVDYLVSKGIDGGRLKSVGYGEQFPVGDNNTEEGRAKSRRTVVKVDK